MDRVPRKPSAFEGSQLNWKWGTAGRDRRPIVMAIRASPDAAGLTAVAGVKSE